MRSLPHVNLFFFSFLHESLHNPVPCVAVAAAELISLNEPCFLVLFLPILTTFFFALSGSREDQGKGSPLHTEPMWERSENSHGERVRS